ncbi:hypothetical protein D3C85_1838490 [compost metagenome]
MPHRIEQNENRNDRHGERCNDAIKDREIIRTVQFGRFNQAFWDIGKKRASDDDIPNTDCTKNDKRPA